MSKILISQLQTEENILLDLQSIDAHNVMGGKKYYDRDDHYDRDDDHRGGGHGRGHGGHGGHGHGGGYCPPYH